MFTNLYNLVVWAFIQGDERILMVLHKYYRAMDLIKMSNVEFCPLVYRPFGGYYEQTTETNS